MRTRAFAFGAFLVTVPLAAASGGAWDVVASGVESAPIEGTRKVAVDRTVEVGPRDGLLVTMWTKTAGRRSLYRMADRLALTIAGATGDETYGKGFCWSRATDWDGKEGNPDKDSAGRRAWWYRRIPFGREGVGSRPSGSFGASHPAPQAPLPGGLGGAKRRTDLIERPWYAGRLLRMDSFRDERWQKWASPGADARHLYLYAWARDWTHGYPAAEWRNPTGRTLSLRISGELELGWVEQGKDDIHYAVVLMRARRDAFDVDWGVDRRLRAVRAVFTHPTMPGRLAVSTASGIALSSDGGRSWRELEAPERRALGEVNSVAFAPDSPDVFYVATGAAGLWATYDGGKTLRRVGSARSGMASDSVRAVYFYPGDADFRTLIAVHGEAAPGISRSDDAGSRGPRPRPVDSPGRERPGWRLVARGFHVFGLCHGEPERSGLFYMIAAKKDSPEVVSIWSSPGLGEYWYEILRDVLPTDGAAGAPGSGRTYWATMDRGLFRLTASWSAVLPERAGPDDADEWASVGVAAGGGAGREVAYAYEPRRLGLVVSEDGFRTFTSHSRGLLVGPYVRDGAHVRANANGSLFLAVVNGALYRGIARGGALAASEIAVDPAVVTYERGRYVAARYGIRKLVEAFPKERDAAAAARAIVEKARAADLAFSTLSLTVTARVEGGARPEAVTYDRSRDVPVTAPAPSPPVSGNGGRVGRLQRSRTVLVDLSPVGGGEATAMLDDGRNGDGAAGDGVYGARHDIRPSAVIPDWRDGGRDLRGLVELAVTAAAPGGPSANGRATASCILSVLRRRESFVFWQDRDAWVSRRTGEVTATVVKDDGAPFEGEACLKIAAGPGEWSVTFGNDWRRHDITGYHALSFWAKADGRAAPGGGNELYAYLTDRPENSFRVSTGRAAVLADGLVEGGPGREPAPPKQPRPRRPKGSGARPAKLQRRTGGALGPEYRRVVVPLAALLGEARGFQERITTFVGFAGEGAGTRTYWIDDIRFFASGEDLEADRQRVRAEAEKAREAARARNGK